MKSLRIWKNHHGFRAAISEHTVKNHVKNILAKLNANDRTDAIMIAVRRGIIEM